MQGSDPWSDAPGIDGYSKSMVHLTIGPMTADAFLRHDTSDIAYNTDLPPHRVEQLKRQVRSAVQA